MRRQLLMAVATCAALVAGLAPARAEQITATLSYTDGSGATVPLTTTIVEIWRLRLRGPIFWNWERDAVAVTNSAGQLSASLPYFGNGVVTALRVFATNLSAQVFTQDLYANPFYRQPGLPGPEITRTTTGSGNVLDFSFQFTDAWAARHFNVAEVVQRGATYAAARRDLRETDEIGRTTVLMNSLGSTFYDTAAHAVRLDAGLALDDFTVLHEYAHALEEKISGFHAIGGSRNGCIGPVVDPGYAWMEGFADYFALAVAASLPPGVINGPAVGTTPPAVIERPSCPGSTQPPATVENFVAGALFDLIDAKNPAEPGDTVCASEFPADTLIFQIFDRELDLGDVNPTIADFATVWMQRGLPLPPLQRVFAASGITVPLPAPIVHYDTNPADNFAIWRQTTAQFWVYQGQAGIPFTWGSPGDAPAPADYDGDGLTDAATFRNRDATWLILLSASGRAVSTPWGFGGTFPPVNLPLPADYDGDGAAELAVYLPSDGTLWIHAGTCSSSVTPFDLGRGTPVVGDFDRDGKADPGVWDDANRRFTIFLPTGPVTLAMPVSGVPVVKDFDGDGKADVAVFEPATANWHIRATATGAVSVRSAGEPFGVPVPGDYDGDGRVDLVTWAADGGMWSGAGSRGPGILFQWGEPGDVPVPAR